MVTMTMTMTMSDDDDDDNDDDGQNFLKRRRKRKLLKSHKMRSSVYDSACHAKLTQIYCIDHPLIVLIIARC